MTKRPLIYSELDEKISGTITLSHLAVKSVASRQQCRAKAYYSENGVSVTKTLFGRTFQAFYTPERCTVWIHHFVESYPSRDY